MAIAEEIAEQYRLDQSAVSREIIKFGENRHLSESAKVLFRDDFDPPIYNVWKQQNKSNRVGHFGKTEARWLSIEGRYRVGIFLLADMSDNRAFPIDIGWSQGVA